MTGAERRHAIGKRERDRDAEQVDAEAEEAPADPSRRDFLKRSSLTAAAVAGTSTAGMPLRAEAARSPFKLEYTVTRRRRRRALIERRVSLSTPRGL